MRTCRAEGDGEPEGEAVADAPADALPAELAAGLAAPPQPGNASSRETISSSDAGRLAHMRKRLARAVPRDQKDRYDDAADRGLEESDVPSGSEMQLGADDDREV